MQHIDIQAFAEKKQPEFDALRQPVKSDLAAVDKFILHELHSEIATINDVTAHVVKSGGKRLRPLITLLTANMFGYTGDQEHHELAAIIEFIHTATLLHDDVIDNSQLRRNHPTANTLWDNATAVLAGDYLYSRAFQILARRSNIPVMKVLADTTNQISEGEILQLTLRGNCNLNEQDYFRIIHCKTAVLYSAAAEIGAIIATNNATEQRKIAADYGLHLGLAFQLIDDLLDYQADSRITGKNLGDDLAEGKVTLPLLYTLQNGTVKQQQVIQQAIKSGGREAIDEVTQIIINSDGSQYTFDRAQQEAQLALSALNRLPQNIYRQTLAEVCNFVLHRDF